MFRAFYLFQPGGFSDLFGWEAQAQTSFDEPGSLTCQIQSGQIPGGSGGSTSSPALTVSAEAATDEGRVRERNEDSFVLLPRKQLYLVADGMGGHNAGEVASRMAVRVIGRIFQTHPGASISQRVSNLKTAIELSSEIVFERALRRPEYAGMGTTVVGLHLDELGGYFCAAHIGDSRIYRIRKGTIEQLTRDHSLINQLIDMGCTPEFAMQARKNIIVRAVGLEDAIEADVQSGPIEDGDIFLLCSDGLTDVLDDEAILEVILSCQDLKAACQELIHRANDEGGPDNITAVLVRAGKPSKP